MSLHALREGQFKCMYTYCGRLLPLVAIEPICDAHGWAFVCPVCSHKSKLVNAGGDGEADIFVQPEADEHGRHVFGGTWAA